ncbi:T9SS type A sorting domain-containing protein [Candidatus Latescibacterota bacterium]
MRKIALLLLVLIFASSTAFAAFAPEILRLSAPPEIAYDFDGTELEIPVTVSGVPATLFFLVHTKGIASTVPNMRNGYLGWHHVCKIDTCVYLSPQNLLPVGQNTITWNGLDDDGGVVAAGEYTYYMWAFDSDSPKQKMSYMLGHDLIRQCDFQEEDMNGNPLNNPIYHQTRDPNFRWEVGGDPYDETHAVTCNLASVIPTDFSIPKNGHTLFDPDDWDYMYIRIGSNTLESHACAKYKFVPGGDAILQTDWAENGLCIVHSGPYRNESGWVTDGTYMYGGKEDQKNTMAPSSWMFMVDFDGTLVETFDLRPWWTRPDEAAQGKAMNSGPDQFTERNGFITMNSYSCCTKQLVNPARYLESGEYEDMFLWTNLNGDYVLDQNFQETAAVLWACHYPVTSYQYVMDGDENFFSICSAYDMGAVSFGLIGPDGTGIGFLSFSGETGGWKKGQLYLDGDTPFDGIYMDNDQAGGTHYQEGGWQPNDYTEGIYFVGHDSIKGVISNVVGVADEAPAAIDMITLAQNAPNPFNPTTTINFSLARAGNTAVEVYNVAGQKVDTIVDEYMESGSHSAVWEASEFSAGIYFCTVKNNETSRTIKMTLVK